MHAFEDVPVEISVVLGATDMQICNLLKMGRGAVIDLEADKDEKVYVYANNKLIARGEITLVGDSIAVTITDTVGKIAV
jgi:flagellar motor switch protein FliN/FliY